MIIYIYFKKMLIFLILMIFYSYIELQIHSRNKIVDLGHLLTTKYHKKIKKLNINMIKNINLFYGFFALSPLPIIIFDKNIQTIFLIGMGLRCICGSLTQLPYNKENNGFNYGELGGFGPKKSMIWFFSGHCYSISCAILFLFKNNRFIILLFMSIIQVSLIFWYLSIRAHYSIDMLIGTILPFVINRMIN